MTQTISLSARIATLEQLAEPLPTLRTLLADAEQQCAAYRSKIMEGEHAQRILEHLAEQTARVLAGGELFREAAPALPEPRQPIHDIATTTPEQPASTAESSADTLAVIDDRPQLPAIGDEDEPNPPTQLERLTAWVESLDDTCVLTVRSVAEELNIPLKSAGTILPKLVPLGLLERIPGTGVPSHPAEYRRPRAQQDQAQQTTVEPTLPGTAAPERSSARNITLRPDPEPTPAPNPEPGLRARILFYLEASPGESFMADDLAAALDTEVKVVNLTLGKLVQQQFIQIVPGSRPKEFQAKGSERPSATIAPTPAPAPKQQLPAIPERISVDERCAFDTLRHAPDGLTERVLVARLNWSTSRTQKTLNRLHDAGHIGKAGDVYKVIPAEYQGVAVA